MANLSNINNKFLVTTGGNVLIGQTTAIGSSIFQVTGASTFTGNITAGTAIFQGGGDTVILRKGTGTPALTFQGTASDPQVTGLIEGISGGGLKFYTSSGTQSAPAYGLKITLALSGKTTFAGNVDVAGGNLESRTITGDAYTPAAFNDKSLLTLRNADGDTNYAGIQFSNNSGNYEWFQGAVQTSATRAEYVFQGYDGVSAYKEHLRIKENSDVIFVGLVSGITPTAAANFTTKAYVDALDPKDGPYLPLAGGTMNSAAAIGFVVASGGGNFINITHTGNEAWSIGAQSGAGADDYLDIGIDGGTRAMSWHETGNVGIGTSGFAQKRLDVSGPTGGQVLITGASDDVGTTAGIMFRSEASEENGLARVKGGIFFERIAGTYGNGFLKFAVNSSANNDTVAVSDVALEIDNNKNVRTYAKLGIRVDGDAIPWRGVAQIPAVINLAGNGALFTRPDYTYLGQNFYYNASDTGAVIDAGQASLIELGDGGFKFYGSTAGAANAAISLSERMAISNAGAVTIVGKLGIGASTAPTVPLDVTGSSSGASVRIKGDMGSGSYYYGFLFDGTKIKGTTQSNIYMAAGVVDGDTTIASWSGLRIEAPVIPASSSVTNSFGINQVSNAQKNFFNGNVGIGTSGPTKKLHVDGDQLIFGNLFLQSSANGFRAISMNTADAADNQELYLCGGATASSTRGAQIGVYGNEVGTTGGSVVIVAGNTSTGDIDFLTANEQRMIINNAGEVGIGIIVPGAKLNVNGTTKLGGACHFSSDGSFVTSYNYTFRDGVYINNPNSSSAVGTSKSVMSIGASSGNSIVTSLTTTGAIGIGVTNPNALLDVGGTSTFQVGMALFTESSTTAYLTTSFNSRPTHTLYGINTTNTYVGTRLSHAGNTEFFHGIVKGASNGEMKYVFQGYNGAAYQEFGYIDCYTTNAGSLIMSGDVVAYSDKKLKKNIKTLDGSKVYKMRGVSFDRIDTGKKSSGVIAQEMQEIAPELVNESGDTLGVAYGNISGYLIEAIKELEARIKILENK